MPGYHHNNISICICHKVEMLKRMTLSIHIETRTVGWKGGRKGECIQCRLLLLLLSYISSSHIINSVCWSQSLVNGPTSKRPASDGGRCSGQLLMMWWAVCSGSPHSHAELSASPHFFMDALYRPTLLCSIFAFKHIVRNHKAVVWITNHATLLHSAMMMASSPDAWYTT